MACRYFGVMAPNKYLDVDSYIDISIVSRTFEINQHFPDNPTITIYTLRYG